MKLTAIHSPFTTFCEGREDIEAGFKLFLLFHERNFWHRIPSRKDSDVLVVSSGVGYFQHSLKKWGYSNVFGVDSDDKKVKYAQRKGYDSECVDCFKFLEGVDNKYNLIFAEQELNHLTRDECLLFLRLCHKALKIDGKLIINAGNCANPIISTEYLGNNIDHYTSFTENSMKQYFSLTPFGASIEIFPHDLYVLKRNPLNYIAKGATTAIHLLLRVLFTIYGKNNRIFTKRLGVVATK